MNQQLPHRKSPRLPDFDYAQNGVYFVTVCSHHRVCLFGEIQNFLFSPSALGKIAQQEIERLATYWKQVEVDCAVVMPNHVHLVVVIFGDSLTKAQTHPQAESLPTLGHIIGNYKSGVTRKARQEQLIASKELIWQNRYHDHIVRDERSLNTVREYVLNNPARWQEDTFYDG